MEKKWQNFWENLDYIKLKENNFIVLDNFLKTPPNCILDIGCGLAFESEMFQKKYNTELYLLDGDFSQTENNKRDIEYGGVENFRFYSKIDDLKSSFNQRNLRYFFVDANNIQIPNEKKFDLIYSILSCGFHYPADIYREVIMKHSHQETKVIMDIRTTTLNEQAKHFDVLSIIHKGKKHHTCQIRFKK